MLTDWYRLWLVDIKDPAVFLFLLFFCSSLLCIALQACIAMKLVVVLCLVAILSFVNAQFHGGDFVTAYPDRFSWEMISFCSFFASLLLPFFDLWHIFSNNTSFLDEIDAHRNVIFVAGEGYVREVVEEPFELSYHHEYFRQSWHRYLDFKVFTSFYTFYAFLCYFLSWGEGKWCPLNSLTNNHFANRGQILWFRGTSFYLLFIFFLLLPLLFFSLEAMLFLPGLSFLHTLSPHTSFWSLFNQSYRCSITTKSHTSLVPLRPALMGILQYLRGGGGEGEYKKKEQKEKRILWYCLVSATASALQQSQTMTTTTCQAMSKSLLWPPLICTSTL